MYKILMIVNPKAGKGKITKYVEKIKDNLEEKKYSLEIEYTSLEKNATEIVKGYHSYFDIVLVCGGDGTLNEVIEGLVYLNKKAFVGFVPFLGSVVEPGFKKYISYSFVINPVCTCP